MGTASWIKRRSFSGSASTLPPRPTTTASQLIQAAVPPIRFRFQLDTQLQQRFAKCFGIVSTDDLVLVVSAAARANSQTVSSTPM